MNISEFLRERGARFTVIPHGETYDTQRMAEAIHVHGCEVAKTVLLRASGGYRYIVAILPAPMMIDLDKVSSVLGGSKMSLATAVEVASCCPDCDFGALPPFGSQYNLMTLVDSSLAEDECIYFEGNTHREAIQMPFEDFRRIEEPLIGSFAVPANPKLPHTRSKCGDEFEHSRFGESGSEVPGHVEAEVPHVYRGFRQ